MRGRKRKVSISVWLGNGCVARYEQLAKKCVPQWIVKGERNGTNSEPD